MHTECVCTQRSGSCWRCGPQCLKFAIAASGVMPRTLISASIYSGISRIHFHHLWGWKTAQQINYQMPRMLPGWLTVGPECHFRSKCCSIKRIGGLRPVTSPLLLQASSPIFQEVHSSLATSYPASSNISMSPTVIVPLDVATTVADIVQTFGRKLAAKAPVMYLMNKVSQQALTWYI